MPDVQENNNIASRSPRSSQSAEDETTEKTEDGDESVSESSGWIHCWKILWKITTSQVGLIVLLLCYSFAGAAIMQAIEGPHEIRGINQRARDRKILVQEAWQLAQNLSAENFTDVLELKLKEYESQLATVLMHGLSSRGDQAMWDYWGALFYCATVFTTIGYGNIAPATSWGRVTTMIYAIIGIPLFLVIMGKLGKVMTRCLKFVWRYVRRLYYADCSRSFRRRIRQTEAYQKLKAACTCTCKKENDADSSEPPLTPTLQTTSNGTPGIVLNAKTLSRQSTVQSVYDEEDDCDNPEEFNLHPVIAMTITAIYIFVGAWMYTRWEPWSYLEAFYFLFISVSTIGFGDVIPHHPKYFLASSAYIVLGLALVAMCINVIMEFYNRTIDRAKEKVIDVGRHMGLDIEELEAIRSHRNPSPTPDMRRRGTRDIGITRSRESLDSGSGLLVHGPTKTMGSFENTEHVKHGNRHKSPSRQTSSIEISTPAAMFAHSSKSPNKKHSKQSVSTEEEVLSDHSGLSNQGFEEETSAVTGSTDVHHEDETKGSS